MPLQSICRTLDRRSGLVLDKKNKLQGCTSFTTSKAPEKRSPMLLSIPYVYATIRSFVQKSFA